MATLQRAAEERTATILQLYHLNFSLRKVRTALVDVFLAYKTAGKTLEGLSIVECPETAYLEVVLGSASECGIARSIKVVGPLPLRRIYLSLLMFRHPNEILKTLCFESINLTSRDARFLREALMEGSCDNDGVESARKQRNCPLELLVLNHVVFDDNETLRLLCESIRSNKSLRHLQLTQRSYWRTADDLKLVLQSLSNHPTLTSLHLAPLFTSQLMAIIPGLRLPNHLKSLKLLLIDRAMDGEDMKTLSAGVVELLTDPQNSVT